MWVEIGKDASTTSEWVLREILRMDGSMIHFSAQALEIGPCADLGSEIADNNLV